MTTSICYSLHGIVYTIVYMGQYALYSTRDSIHYSLHGTCNVFTDCSVLSYVILLIIVLYSVINEIVILPGILCVSGGLFWDMWYYIYIICIYWHTLQLITFNTATRVGFD